VSSRAEKAHVQRQWALMQMQREERRRAAAAERRRLLRLHFAGATSIDEQRLLFPTQLPHR